MNRFYQILREEMDKVFSVGGAFANKVSAMASFDKAFALAVVKYAKEKGVDLT